MQVHIHNLNTESRPKSSLRSALRTLFVTFIVVSFLVLTDTLTTCYSLVVGVGFEQNPLYLGGRPHDNILTKLAVDGVILFLASSTIAIVAIRFGVVEASSVRLRDAYREWGTFLSRGHYMNGGDGGFVLLCAMITLPAAMFLSGVNNISVFISGMGWIDVLVKLMGWPVAKPVYFVSLVLFGNALSPIFVWAITKNSKTPQGLANHMQPDA